MVGPVLNELGDDFSRYALCLHPADDACPASCDQAVDQGPMGPVYVVPPAIARRVMGHGDIAQLFRPFLPINAADPVVHPPVTQHRGVIIVKDLLVQAVREVVPEIGVSCHIAKIHHRNISR